MNVLSKRFIQLESQINTFLYSIEEDEEFYQSYLQESDNILNSILNKIPNLCRLAIVSYTIKDILDNASNEIESKKYRALEVYPEDKEDIMTIIYESYLNKSIKTVLQDYLKLVEKFNNLSLKETLLEKEKDFVSYFNELDKIELREADYIMDTYVNIRYQFDVGNMDFSDIQEDEKIKKIYNVINLYQQKIK